jgi:hypothetical protein
MSLLTLKTNSPPTATITASAGGMSTVTVSGTYFGGTPGAVTGWVTNLAVAAPNTVLGVGTFTPIGSIPSGGTVASITDQWTVTFTVLNAWTAGQLLFIVYASDGTPKGGDITLTFFAQPGAGARRRHKPHKEK